MVQYSVLNAERNAHHAVAEVDVFTAFASSKNFHHSATVKALITGERELLKHIAELSILDPDRPITTGNLFYQSRLHWNLLHRILHRLNLHCRNFLHRILHRLNLHCRKLSHRNLPRLIRTSLRLRSPPVPGPQLSRE